MGAVLAFCGPRGFRGGRSRSPWQRVGTRLGRPWVQYLRCGASAHAALEPEHQQHQQARPRVRALPRPAIVPIVFAGPRGRASDGSRGSPGAFPPGYPKALRALPGAVGLYPCTQRDWNAGLEHFSRGSGRESGSRVPEDRRARVFGEAVWPASLLAVVV